MRISKFASMTTGLVLILLGVQLLLVKSYLLTPSATRFMAEHFNQNPESRFSEQAGAQNSGNFNSNQLSATPSYSQPGQTWPYYRTNQPGTSFSGFNSNSTVPAQLGSLVSPVPPGYQHRYVPPQWIMWPALFVGAVLFLHGLALRA